MTTGTIRVAVRIAAAAALLYATRRYYRNWGTTKEECQRWLPGDELIRQPSVRSTEGVWIDASDSDVWPWLVQIGHRDADRIDPARQGLQPGDVVHLAPTRWPGLRNRLSMSVVQVIAGEAVVLRGNRPGFPWEAVWSVHVQPHWQDRCRVLVRTRAQLRHPGDVILAELAGPLTALVVRRTLLAVKRRAQGSALRAESHRAG
ncbi:hypothetical protein [Mycolicibacterium holsaticum]|jgi:hypothetical protein|uniref:Polyketide cyclase n=1 Tax=Mycolicibacterium holsaticum TaxID=152142 RepID=A0A1E3RCH6_9MYCO|nr:hypothetical protein [Mycolicibacterium holsaticum]ODQ87596.1 hypothetical protein BHQ17_18945 [Mycolicibacterium holsaticum]